MKEELQALTDEIKLWREGQQEHIEKLNKLILGNGNVGLCEHVRSLATQAKALWTLVGIIGACILTGVVKLIFFT
jgi:hypothetical protein